MAKQTRFICIYEQGSLESAKILVDTQTGVNYLFVRKGVTAGLSPLLDAEGKPVVTKEHISGN